MATPATAPGVASIAAFDNYVDATVYAVGTYKIDNGETGSFNWLVGKADSWANVTRPLWAKTTSGCGLPNDTPQDMSPYVAFIGDNCWNDEDTLRSRGLKYLVRFSDSPSVATTAGSSTRGSSNGVMTTKEAEKVVSILRSGASIEVSMSDSGANQALVLEPNTKTGGQVSVSSTWGPTAELDLKPNFGAPGGLILSTIPTAQGSYGTMSGTSMSTPFVAGVYALIAQARGTHDPNMLRNLVASTSKPAKDSRGGSYFHSIAQQGAGLVQAYDAAHVTTVLSASHINLNDTQHFNKHANFSIENTGSKSATYEFGNVPAGTAYALTADGNTRPINTVASFADLTFEEKKVTVPAGGSAIISFSVTPPKGLSGLRIPVCSGFVTLNGTNGDNLSLPYLGVAGNMRDAKVLRSVSLESWSYPGALNPGTVFNLNTNRPVVAINPAVPSPLHRIDVIPKDANAKTTTVLGRKVLGTLSGYPVKWQAGGQTIRTSGWTGYLEDGTRVPNGRYTLLVRLLKIFGDPENPDDYESEETVEFFIRY
jgi:subtilisin family serine protease